MSEQTLIHIIKIKVGKNLAGNMSIVLIVRAFKMYFVKSSRRDGDTIHGVLNFQLKSFINTIAISNLIVSKQIDEPIAVKGHPQGGKKEVSQEENQYPET